MKEYVVFFVHRHLDFRFPELDALLTMQSLRPEDCYTREQNPLSSPLVRVRLPSEAHAKFLSQRGILVKGVYEMWGQGKTYEELVRAVDEYEGKQVFLTDPSMSWKIQVDAFGLKLSMDEQKARREKFRDILPFAGPVMMKDPKLTFLILEEIGLDTTKTDPERIFFLRALAGGEKNRGRGGARDLVDMQTLKRRAYIGPTSMDAEMALIMCNMALIQSGDLVIDPFVGTGSVLVPCTTFGGICMGTDIDSRVLHGKNDKTIESNFHQYNLRVPDLVRADNSRSPLRCPNYFDAVVCDPPYGIRAGARKSGRRECGTDQEQAFTSTNKPKFGPRTIPDEYIDSHIPATQPYAAEDVMNDLLTFAATNLRIGGRVVYLLPTTYDYTDADLPTHPQLRVVANSEEKLTTKYARRLITMEKVAADDSVEKPAAPFKSTFSFAKLREKIIESNKKHKGNN